MNVSKDEFISLASRQLQTPATDVKKQELLKKAYESNECQLRIISGLLKVAQVDAGKIKTLKNDTDMHEGTIRMASKPNIGTTFSITLPK
jgi:hypothetical protein